MPKESRYSEFKRNVTLSLTPTATEYLNKMAERAGVSRSELVELMARGTISSRLAVGTEERLLGESCAN